MPDNKIEVYEVVHSSPELKTVADYILDPSSPAHQYAKNMDEFLLVKNKAGKTNRQVIEASYKSKVDKKLIGKSANDLKLKVGTILAVPTDKIDRVGLLTQGIQVVSNNIPAFKARMLAELETKENYKPVTSYKPIRGKLTKGITKEEYPDVTVWVWCRALSNTRDNKGQIFNITPFVQKVNSNVGKNGGNFQITLPPLVCELNDKGQWVIKRKSLKRYETSKFASLQGDGYVAEGSFYKAPLEQPDENKASDNVLKRNQFLFHNIITPNDVVWIRYETLECEKEQRIDDNKTFYIDKSNLAGRIYDMIGLVDSNTQSVNPQTNDVSISIVGRDLSKLFIEDGTYFYALEMSQGQLNFAGGSTEQNELMQRVFTDNALPYFGLYYNNSIEHVLKFVIQQLSSIKIVPNDLFTSYAKDGVERRNKKFFPEKKQLNQPKSQSEKLQELEDKIKEDIATIRKQVELTEKQKATEDKEVHKVWRALYSFMKDLRTQKVRQVSGSSTIGWSSFTYKNPISGVNEKIEKDMFPKYFYSNLHITLYYTKSQAYRNGEVDLFNNIDKYLDLESAQPEHKDIWTEDLANGIWQIVKLVIDDGVTERRIVDSSISSANGSLLNFIRKVCQEPFVEFYMDTYGDMYHLIVRKPPTDKKGITSMLQGQVSVDTNKDGKNDKVVPTVIDIEPEDVISEQLSYDDRGAITWYHLTPQANFIGNTSTYSLAYLPAIFFQEYADIWGSRAMQLTHNYMPRLPLNPQQSTLDITEKQAFEDLKFMVESNAYIPFTRKGTIVVNGDRRLKYGNIIRYKSTGEIFFIDHVQQQFTINESSVDRTTTIQVSRGMREPVIYGVSTIEEKTYNAGEPFSYFNIINTDLIIEEKEFVETKTERVQVGTQRIPGTPASNATPTGLQINGLYSGVERYRGYKYGFGLAGGDGRSIDCSGFVTRVLQIAGVKIGRTTSEEIMKQSNGFRQVQNFDYQTMQEGDVLGFDTGRTRSNFDKGRAYGIDHIAIVVKNYNTGKLELAESVGSVGVRTRPLAQGVAHYDRVCVRKYVGNFRGDFSSTGTPDTFTPIYEDRTYTVKRKGIDRDKVFSNFKVYKDCFDFLLRRKANDDKLVSVVLPDVVVTSGKNQSENINNLTDEQLKQLSEKIKNRVY